ncbi:hypothetical protein BVX98_01940 [bacterium F11]|nr:hypothetical protein BVX98_01940 [bacterium F11]
MVQLRKRRDGMVMPMVLVFLTGVSILGVFILHRFGTIGSKEHIETIAITDQYQKAVGGLERGHFDLLRPDNIGLEHRWGMSSTPTVKTISIDGETVTMTVHDISISTE